MWSCFQYCIQSQEFNRLLLLHLVLNTNETCCWGSWWDFWNKSMLRLNLNLGSGGFSYHNISETILSINKYKFSILGWKSLNTQCQPSSSFTSTSCLYPQPWPSCSCALAFWSLFYLGKRIKNQNKNIFNILFIEQCLFSALDESEVLLKNKCDQVDFPSTCMQGTTLDWIGKLKWYFWTPVFLFVALMFV